MKRFPLLLPLLALAAFSSADSLRSQIEAVNKMMGEVIKKRDINLFLKTVKGGVSKDFKYIEAGKVSNFDTMVAGMKGGFAMLSKVDTATAKIATLVEKGNTATCTTEHYISAQTMDEHKKPHKFEVIGLSVETYRNEKGKWLMTSMNWKKQTIKMDGKAMPAPGKA